MKGTVYDLEGTRFVTRKTAVSLHSLRDGVAPGQRRIGTHHDGGYYDILLSVDDTEGEDGSIGAGGEIVCGIFVPDLDPSTVELDPNTARMILVATLKARFGDDVEIPFAEEEAGRETSA